MKVKQCLKKVSAVVSATVMSAFFFLQNATKVFAISDALTDIEKASGAGTFDEVETVVKGVAVDGYDLATLIGAAVALICGCIALIMMMVSKKAQNKEENKSWIATILLCVAAIGALVAVVSIVADIGGSIGQ